MTADEVWPEGRYTDEQARESFRRWLAGKWGGKSIMAEAVRGAVQHEFKLLHDELTHLQAKYDVLLTTTRLMAGLPAVKP